MQNIVNRNLTMHTIYKFTFGANMKNSLGTTTLSGYVLEGIQGYAYLSPGPGLKPIYVHATKKGSTDHVYTADYNELGAGNFTWCYEGIAFYV